MATISVLHVDDDPAMVDLTATYLGRVRDDIEVRTATSGREALETIETERVDCVVSDYDMPTMNGLDLLEAVREFDPDLPFVLFTGKGSEEIASEAISAGVTDYLQKGTGTERYEILANRVANAVSQFDAERLARQHARVNDVLRQTIQSIVAAQTREAVLEAACRSLSGAEPYLFAVCVEPEPDSESLSPVCWAGEDRGFLDAIEGIGVRMDDSPTGQGPGGRAARTGEVQVLEDIHEDPSFEPWRQHAESRGFESVAAIPLRYRSTFHGVLGVFADRPNAFDEIERDVLSTLGTAIAHAIHATELEARA
jgi:CheY-like chemotaxis protein/putative methionine-R-sulfoxide reductase with GAF domain